MSQPTRSIWGTVLKNLINSFKPRKLRGDLVGKDHLGNTYYQIDKSAQRVQRWFEPPLKDNFQQELPAEWESWLRYRRKVPPSEQEVLSNAALAKQKQLNAAELDAQRSPKLKAHSPKSTHSQNSFPKYDEYEVIPGLENKESTTKNYKS